MRSIRKKIVTDESAQPLAVQIDYADWLEIERILRSDNGQGSAVTGARPIDSASQKHPTYPLHGTIVRYDAPFEPAATEREWDALR